MAEMVYLLCGLTSLICAALLYRGYYRSRLRLLFWSCACFACFAATSIFLILDLMVFPANDFSLVRNGLNLLGVMMMIYGMSETV